MSVLCAPPSAKVCRIIPFVNDVKMYGTQTKNPVCIPTIHVWSPSRKNEVSINAGYEKVRESEKEKENINTKSVPKHPQTYQEAAQLYGGLQQGHLPNRKNKEKNNDKFTEEQLVNALISTKTPVNVLDSIIPKWESIYGGIFSKWRPYQNKN